MGYYIRTSRYLLRLAEFSLCAERLIHRPRQQLRFYDDRWLQYSHLTLFTLPPLLDLVRIAGETANAIENIRYNGFNFC
jgi:hypothetical protein